MTTAMSSCILIEVQKTRFTSSVLPRPISTFINLCTDTIKATLRNENNITMPPTTLYIPKSSTPITPNKTRDV